MLKLLTPTDLEPLSLHTKCGEIHYQKSHWQFLCIICGLKAASNDEFRNHFELKHLNDFLETCHRNLVNPANLIFLEEETIAATNLNLNKSNVDDPLHLNENRIIVKEEYCSKELYNIVENEKEKGERDQVSTDTERICEVLSNRVASNTNNCDESSINKSHSESDSHDELETGSLSENGLHNESKIDWNTPFQPGFLKISEKRPYKPRNKVYSCTYCGRTFRRRYQLDTHLNIHTGAKPHQCEICGRQFRAVTTLQRHLNTHEKRNFVCSYCDKCFTHKVALLSHESRHTQERRESCDLCEKQFYTLNQLDTHKRRVHKKSNDILPFACDLCPNRYRTASMLSTHKCRKHYKSAKFHCEKCDKKFIDIQRLEEHQKIHVDGKVSSPYVNASKNS